MKHKSNKVYITHKIKPDCIDMLEKLSQFTGKLKAELIEDLIEVEYNNYLERILLKEDDKTHRDFLEVGVDQELIDQKKRWKDSNQGLNEFNQRMEDWKKEEKRKNKKQAEDVKKKLDDWAKTWQKYFRDYSFSISEDNSYQFIYFNATDGADVWKKQMREYTRQWHPDYAPNDGNPQKFGEMKAEYDILTGKIPTEEYSL